MPLFFLPENALLFFGSGPKFADLIRPPSLAAEMFIGFPRQERSLDELSLMLSHQSFEFPKTARS